MFRVRDPGASLEGVIDYVVIIRLLAMIAGGLWVLYQWRKQSREVRGNPPFKLRLPQKLGLAVVACLSLSICFNSSGLERLQGVRNACVAIFYCGIC